MVPSGAGACKIADALYPTERMIRTAIHGVALTFETDPRLFSPKRVDAGTLAMLTRARFESNDKVLDLGCGYGAVGVYAAKILAPEQVWMSDNDPVAIAAAKNNLLLNGVAGAKLVLSDGFRDFKESGFTKILFNPPFHVDFSLPKHFIEKGFNRLALDGQMLCVTKRRVWYENKLKAIFGRVRIEPLGGYFVFTATKSAHSFANR